jgi:hypothetical protein
MKINHGRGYHFLIIPLMFLGLIIAEINIVNDYLNIEKWKYFIWQGEARGLKSILIWNAISILFVGLYFSKLKYYERYIAPYVSLFLFIVLIFSPYIFGNKIKDILANSATFKNEGIIFLDFKTNVYSARCIFDSVIENYCKNNNSSIFPYGNTAIIFKFVPTQLIEQIALILNIVTLVLLVYVIVKLLGFAPLPIFLSSPWIYFALERANADLYLLIILLIGSYFSIKKLKILYWASIFFMLTLKPIYAGYLLSTKISIKNMFLFVAGVVLILSSYDFSLSNLSKNRAIVNPTPFGSIGLSDLNELINVIFPNINFALIILVLAGFTLAILYIDKKNLMPFATTNKSNDFTVRNMFLILVIIIAGNQVNYKLILLIPLMVIAMADYNKNLFVITLLGLITIGQHTIIRNVLIFVLTVLLTKYLIIDLKFKINKKVRVARN